jgi:hypothetical protein
MDESDRRHGDLSNRHPAGRLGDVRAQIKELENEEIKLRSYLLQHPDDLTGLEYTALVSSRSYKRVNMDSLRREVGDAVLRRHTTTTPVSYVRLKTRNAVAA